ncbi:MAG: tetratricopeptide repeat protein [Cyclobacteriaceae bacterium]|nr:tetratricopeptide repeat protein [Cyclobacteriaceae bacterium]
MKVVLLLLLTLLIDPSKIGKTNEAKNKAKESYARGEYKEAVEQYRTLIDSLGVNEEEVSMNLAHSYFQLNDTLNARNAYLGMTNSNNANYKSISYQQLGNLSHRQGKLEEALAYFKSALKANPANEEARFNYELVKKKLDEQKKQQQQQRNDQDKKDQDQKENKDQQDKKDQKQNEQQKKDQEKKEQEEKKKQEQQAKEKKEQQKKEQEQKKEDEKKDDKKEPQPSSEKMKMMKISEEKAKMVLEAMKNQEIQYLQQNKRKATKPKDKGKPDW